MKKNEIRTDEEAPLTTPVDASVLEHHRPPLRDRFAIGKTEVEKNIFQEKRKSQSISFSMKRSIPLLLSYLLFNSKVMTLKPEVYISTLSQ
jgi:hypothetical protein